MGALCIVSYARFPTTFPLGKEESSKKIRIACGVRFWGLEVLEGRAYMRNETQNTRAGELADGERVEESAARELKNTVKGLKNAECR